jgi:uncharacterized membrane protein YdbT with pleckstrin-like domain
MRRLYEQIKAPLLRLLKVPPEPTPPAGAAASIRVFRASPRFMWLNLAKWLLTSLAAITGIIIFLLAGHFANTPDRVEFVFKVIEIIGLITIVMGMPFSFFLVVLDYEMRWYIVTDRSLRLRHGVQRVREMTMTFANVQQITIQRGPIQQLFGIADLQVRSAGGGGLGGGAPGAHGDGQEMLDSMHVATFRGVEKPEEIRDLILARLKRLRDSGLGDPDEAAAAEVPAEEGLAQISSPVLAAAREALAEARRLRQVAQGS